MQFPERALLEEFAAEPRRRGAPSIASSEEANAAAPNVKTKRDIRCNAERKCGELLTF